MAMDLSPVDLLRWYLDAGVDEAVGDAPVDRFATRPPPPPPPTPMRELEPARPAALPAARPQPTTVVASGGIVDAADLVELRARLEAFDGLALKKFATNTVFADGSPEADLMVIGEAPGQEEDARGLPFVGRSGRLLDRMLLSIGLERRQVYITNVLPWRPVENRKPTPDEVAVCMPFLRRHIALVRPKVLLLLGGAAASAILERADGINRLRGRWHDYACPGLDAPVPTLATFHPAYLLRTPEAKKMAWRDLLAVHNRLPGPG